MSHDDVSGSPSESGLRAHDLGLRYLNPLLRKESKEPKAPVDRPRTSLSDVPDLQKEKRELLEGLHHACAREEVENECLRHAVADLKFILKSVKRRESSLNHLKRAVRVAKCSVEDERHALAIKDETIRRKDAEIKELLALHEDCALHVQDTASRLGEALKAVGGSRVHETEEASDMKRETSPSAPVQTVHSDISTSGVRDIMIIAGSFVFLLVISLAFRDEEGVDCSCTDHILDSVKGFIMTFSTVHCTELPLD